MDLYQRRLGLAYFFLSSWLSGLSVAMQTVKIASFSVQNTMQLHIAQVAREVLHCSLMCLLNASY